MERAAWPNEEEARLRSSRLVNIAASAAPSRPFRTAREEERHATASHPVSPAHPSCAAFSTGAASPGRSVRWPPGAHGLPERAAVQRRADGTTADREDFAANQHAAGDGRADRR